MLCRCCLSNIARTRYTKYDKAIRSVSADIKSSLNIVNLLRRLRFHGFALVLLLETPLLKFLSNVTKGKPVKRPKLKDSQWEANEAFSFGDRMLVFMLKKLQTELGAKALAKHFIQNNGKDSKKILPMQKQANTQEAKKSHPVNPTSNRTKPKIQDPLQDLENELD